MPESTIHIQITDAADALLYKHTLIHCSRIQFLPKMD